MCVCRDRIHGDGARDLLNPQSDGLPAGKRGGGQIRFETQIVSSRNHVTGQSIGINGRGRIWGHILTFRSSRDCCGSCRGGSSEKRLSDRQRQKDADLPEKNQAHLTSAN